MQNGYANIIQCFKEWPKLTRTCPFVVQITKLVRTCPGGGGDWSQRGAQWNFISVRTVPFIIVSARFDQFGYLTEGNTWTRDGWRSENQYKSIENYSVTFARYGLGFNSIVISWFIVECTIQHLCSQLLALGTVIYAVKALRFWMQSALDNALSGGSRWSFRIDRSVRRVAKVCTEFVPLERWVVGYYYEIKYQIEILQFSLILWNLGHRSIRRLVSCTIDCIYLPSIPVFIMCNLSSFCYLTNEKIYNHK